MIGPLVLDYAHGRDHAVPMGQCVAEPGDQPPLWEDDLLLRIGTALERRLSAEAGMMPGQSLVLTRQDATGTDAFERVRTANRFISWRSSVMVSLHAHRVRRSGPGFRVLRPRGGPSPDPSNGLTPWATEAMRQFREVAELERWRTATAAGALELARRLCGDQVVPRAIPRVRLPDVLTGRHLESDAAALFRDCLIPAAVVEIQLGETDAEVLAMLKEPAPAVAGLYEGLLRAVGWGT